MFKFHQFNLPHNFAETPAHKHIKIRFHSNHAQEEDKVWSLNKIVKLLNISKDMMFENAFQNIRFKVVRGEQVSYEFTVADFTLMNPHDFVVLVQILSKTNTKEVTNPTIYNNLSCMLKNFSYSTILKWL